MEKTNREYLEAKKISTDNYEEKVQENYLLNFPNFLDGINVILGSQIYSDKITVSNYCKGNKFYTTGTGVDGRKYMLIKINLLQNDFSDKEVINKYLSNLENFSLREGPTAKNFLKYYGLIFDEQSHEEFNHYLVFEMPKYNLEDFLMTQFSSLPSSEKFLILREILETLKSLQEKGENNPLAANLKFYFLDENIITLSSGNRDKIYTFKFLNLGQILNMDGINNFKCLNTLTNKNSHFIIDIPFVKEIYRSALLEQTEIFKIQKKFYSLLEDKDNEPDKMNQTENSEKLEKLEKSLYNFKDYENHILSKYYLFAFCNLIHFAFSKNNIHTSQINHGVNPNPNLVENYKNSLTMGLTKVQTLSSEISLNLKTFMIVYSNLDEGISAGVLIGDKMQQAWGSFNDAIEKQIKNKISLINSCDYFSQLSKLSKNIFRLKVKRLTNKDYSIEEINLLDSPKYEKEVEFEGYSIREIKPSKLFINNKRLRIDSGCENPGDNFQKLKKLNSNFKNNFQVVDLTNENENKEVDISTPNNYLKKRNFTSSLNNSIMNNSFMTLNKSDLNPLNSISRSFSKEKDNLVISLLEDTAHVLIFDNSYSNSKILSKSKLDSIKNEVIFNEGVSVAKMNLSRCSKVLDFDQAEQNTNNEKFEFMLKHFTYNNYDSWLTGSNKTEKIKGAIPICVLPKLGEIELNDEISVLKLQHRQNKKLPATNFEKGKKISNIIQSNCNININVTNFYLNPGSNCQNNFQTSSSEIIEKNLGENLMCQLSKIVVLPHRPMEKLWSPQGIMREEYSNLALLDSIGKKNI
jgi:hypothetical protein